MDLSAFQPSPYSSTDGSGSICCAQFVLSIRGENKGPQERGPVVCVIRQRLSHWIVDLLTPSHFPKLRRSPAGLQAYSTRGLVTSWALFREVSVQDIYAAASWLLPLTFLRFYKLDVESPSLAHAALSVGSLVDLPHPHTSA